MEVVAFRIANMPYRDPEVLFLTSLLLTSMVHLAHQHSSAISSSAAVPLVLNNRRSYLKGDGQARCEPVCMTDATQCKPACCGWLDTERTWAGIKILQA